jgi:hypothetical protein
MHKVRGNYSSCACRSSENICRSSSGGAQEKGKRGSKNLMKLNLAQKWCAFLSFTLPWRRLIMYFFAGFFLNLTRFWTKLRVLVLCFPDFTDFFSIMLATNIKGRLKICTLFLVYSQIWLNLSRDDCQYYGMITTLVTNKVTSQSTAPGMTRPVLCKKIGMRLKYPPVIILATYPPTWRGRIF